MKFFSPLKLIFLLSFTLLFIQESRAQAVVTEGTATGLTPLQFVQTYLVGTGVTVSNALYNGSAEPLNSPDRLPLKSRDQIGSFTNSGGAQTQLGIGGGVILSTGFSGKAVAGNNPNDDMQGNNQPAESDPDLVILAGGSAINDKSVLEFDFIPTTDVVTFRYVFGSIEFDGFCSSINDAFGLFLSGPGITGSLGFANDAVNIALLPNSTSYVNIFNICEADQGNLGFGIYSWWNTKKDYYSYNRLTYVFTASFSVQCNQTYHMKFAIGDASDGVLDSGVFLEQNSFSSNNVTTATNFSNPLTGQFLVEGCSGVAISFAIPQAHTSDLIINLAIDPAGTATQADILPNPLPNQAVIPAGQLQSTPIVITSVSDATPEPVENLLINGTTITCGISNTVATELFVKDYNLPTINMNNVTICDGSSASLTPIIIGGQPILPQNSFQYLWSTAETTSSIIVTPPIGHHLYSVTVTDACGQSVNKEISVDVGTTPQAAGTIIGTDTICTPVAGEIYSVPVIIGAESYVWTIPPGGTITSGLNTNAISVDFNTATAPGLIAVYGHSAYCGDGTASTFNLEINPSAPPAGPVSGPGQLCQGPAPVTYSTPTLSFVTRYVWTVPAGVSIVSGSNTNQITCTFGTTATSGPVSVRGFTEACGLGISSEKFVIVDPLPGPASAISNTTGNIICKPELNVQFNVAAIQHAATYNWIYSGTTGTLVNNGTTATIDFTDLATSGNLMVSGQNGCGSGPASPVFPLTVNPKPNIDFLSIPETKTTKNGRPILLRGGTPLGPGGVYNGPGVQETTPGVFIFNPADNAVIGGGTANGIEHTITYRYTNTYNCFDEISFLITVYGSNANATCPGTVRDVRDNKIYPTFQAGAGASARCWTASNLDFGDFTDQAITQTDNFVTEKYCQNNISAACAVSGGYYQWDEVLQYQQNIGYQDICIPGWHVATLQEWQMLIDFTLGNGLAGNFLKDTFTTTGFQGLLNGVYYQNEAWAHLSGPAQGTIFWTSEISTTTTAFARGLNLTNPSVSFYPASRANAFSVRCVKN